MIVTLNNKCLKGPIICIISADVKDEKHNLNTVYIIEGNMKINV